MPVNGLPTMLDSALNSLLKETPVSSFKIEGKGKQTIVVIRMGGYSLKTPPRSISRARTPKHVSIMGMPTCHTMPSRSGSRTRSRTRTSVQKHVSNIRMSRSRSKSRTQKRVRMPRDKYVLQNSNRSDSVHSEATDKGFKLKKFLWRRLRENLKEATAGSDLDDLEKAMDKFTRNRLEDCGDYSNALDRHEYLRLRRDLRDAVRRSHVGILKKTIEEAENSKFTGQLQHPIEAARNKLQHLQELNEFKHDILNMEQSTISEIHSYQRPPVCVHDVMLATYLLLGHPETRLTEWANIQTLLCRVGRDSLSHEIRDFDSAHVDEKTNERVQQILQPHELNTIRQASNGAATFYVWTTQICDKVDRDRSAEGGQRNYPDDISTGQHNGQNEQNRKKHKG